ncbi:hypothetical protein R3W88_022519 [Solanum pinnatisectum]|uniref:Ubiquitin-like protease family profile domain-containing protein n=1 Tax=Solanum pinnatisectum TaxID=50273 RepID=A0AAV9LUY5_9SOLN|nr:hypothetical protein R3W88_022519 [Solanum pinnatisectum]
MRIRNCVAQGQIHRCCMALELECSTRKALVIRVNGTILKFTLRTFALITGLNCVGVTGYFKFKSQEPNKLIVQCSDRQTHQIMIQMVHHFMEKNPDDDFQDEPPPSYKVKGKRKIGQPVSAVKKKRKQQSTAAYQTARNKQSSQVLKRAAKKVGCPKVVRKKLEVVIKNTTTRTSLPTMEFERPSGQFDAENKQTDGRSKSGSKDDKKGVCVNSSMRNLINMNDVFSASRSVVPKTSIEDQIKINHDQTPLPSHRIRRPDPFNTSPYLTTFGSSASSSSVQPLIFELKHPFIFDLISGNHDISLWDAYCSWHDQDYYKKKKADTPVPMNFGVDLKAKYEVGSRYKYTIVDCYVDLDSDVCCVDEEHIIGEYIRGYKMHVGIPWHLVDHIFVLAVASLNDKRINVYESYSAEGHDAAIKIEVKNLAQLIRLKLTMNDYYKNIGLDISLSQEEYEFFEIIFIENIPQQEHESLDCGIYMLAYAEWLSYGQGNPPGNFDAMFLRSRYGAIL